MAQQTNFLRNHLIRDNIYQAIYDKMKVDPSVYIMGEGALVKTHYDAPYIEKEYPDRVLQMPISEDGNLNFAVGASLLGVKPVYDFITADFMFRGMDSICNTAAKTSLLYPELEQTIVIKGEFLTGAPSCGQRIESLFTHIPGLRVVLPSYPDYAYTMMYDALSIKGVTIIFEDREISDSEWEAQDSRALVKSMNGDKLTIISYGLTLRQVHRLIQDPENHLGDIDLIPLQTLYPIDWGAIEAHVNHTGRCLIIEPDIAYMGIGAEIGAFVAEHCYNLLERPIKRLGMQRSIIPESPVNKLLQPSDELIVKTIKEMLS